jgi:glycosyltransferase involved in cell wall biosynthesis
MDVTFVSPPLNMSGGSKVISIYAQKLRARGHNVVLVAPPHVKARSLSTLYRRVPLDPQPVSHFDGKGIRTVIGSAPHGVDASIVPDADVVIATWWETAEWVNRLPRRKGAKAYFIQHHEVHSFIPQQRARATYRMPLHKIVIAQWLADVMAAEYGDTDVDVVPNSVDQAQFFAGPRGKQPVPTVGLLFSRIDWKRFYLALEALHSVRKSVPDLRVICFGIEHPESPLPDFVEFTFSPPQPSLRDLYASCDVWLTASSSEGFNLPAMEAMACRTPVVATRTGWPAEAIVDGHNGACVPIDDVAALAARTTELLQLPDDAWRRVSTNAYETVRTSSWERSTDLFEAALRRLLRSPVAAQ